MNRYFLPYRVAMAWGALLLTPALALAQSPFEGVYIGTFEGTHDDGEFALIVSDQGYAALAAYDALDDTGYVERNIVVQEDGSFRFVTPGGTQVHGLATAERVTGGYFDLDGEGIFAGMRMADEGPFRDAAGYYSGPVSIEGTGPDVDFTVHSRLVAIMAADGSAFFLLDNPFPDGAWQWPGGFGIDLDLDLDLDLDFGFGEGFGLDLVIDFNSPIPSGFGHEAPFPFGPQHHAPFPIGSGTDLPFPFGPGIGAGFPFNTGFNSSFQFGPGFGIDSSFQFGPGACGAFQPGGGHGWPFDFNLDYTLQMSLFGWLDLDLDISLPSCSSWPWDLDFTPVTDSGGTVQVGSGGIIQATLPDGMELLGYLDTQTAMAEGILYQRLDGITWSGDWEIRRQDIGPGTPDSEVYRVLPDIDGDGLADILWNHGLTGEHAAWLMDGPEIDAELALEMPEAPAEGGSQWLLATVGDLAGDDRPDLVWRHAENGEIRVVPGGDADPLIFGLDPAWQIVGHGGFGPDGQPELLVRHRDSGEHALLAELSEPAELILLPESDGLSWTAVAVADFDGDSRPDVLWMNRQTSELRAWLMVEGAPVHEAFLGVSEPENRTLAGIGDFNGDGVADLLWFDEVTGHFGVDLRMGWEAAISIQLEANLQLEPTEAHEWRLAAVGDLDGDGVDDLVWRNRRTGENATWRIVDAQVADTALLPPVPDLNWTIRP